MKTRRAMAALWVAGMTAGWIGPAQAAGLPEGWAQTAGRAGSTVWSSPDAQMLLPVEWTVQFRAPTGSAVTVAATAAPDAKPLVELQFRVQDPNRALVVARSSGEPMETDIRSGRSWSQPNKPSGSLTYAWRYPVIRNLWDDRDRREIGSSYAALAPLAEKTLTVRLVLKKGQRQVWLDDRLVAEGPAANPAAAGLKIQWSGAASVEQVAWNPPLETGSFLPLPLTAYSHARAAKPLPAAGEKVELAGPGGRAVPVLIAPAGSVDVNLGESLYRYRMTKGNGPDAPYVNATHAWPGPFTIDPASLSFRVPYRAWQTAWLLAWSDDKPGAVPRGVFRFYRTQAGFPASTPFEISDAAVRAGNAVKLDRQTAGGKPLYLLRVPVDTDGLYAFRDLADQFLTFELTKPLALSRSYPDPIYYGYHPAGPPSSIRVVGITLEEAAFDYAVTPDRLGHVFTRPEKPGYTVAITNFSDKPLEAKVTLESESFGGVETGTVSGAATVAPGQSADVKLALDPKRNGWFGLRIRVEAGGAVRTNTLSLVMLPPDTRSYGYAPNETRFGIWTLWGHYLPLKAGAYERNEEWLAVMRKLGLRRIGSHGAFLKTESLKRNDFLSKGPHTFVSVFHHLNENDPVAMAAMVSNELGQVESDYNTFPESIYLYGGEWHIGRDIQYAPWPRYTGDGDRALFADEKARADRHIKIYAAIGRAMREKYPKTKLYLQWGAPLGTVAHMKEGFPKELVDGFGMDAPMFELIPENPVGVGSIQHLWGLRQEAEKLGWPRLPIAWVEGPFFPTCPGALTEKQQADYQIRYWLAGLAYGIETFQAGVVDFDGGNYYGAEHYGAGVFNRLPLENPKPAVAAIATATTMLCGADPAGAIDTGVPTTACMAFKHPRDGMRYALWRVRGKADCVLRVKGAKAMVTDSMGNARELAAINGEVTVPVDETPVWVTGAEAVESIRVLAPVYAEAPAAVTRPLTPFTAKQWRYEGTPDKTVTNRHFALRRVPDANLKVEFNADEEGHPGALAVTLPEGPVVKPLAQICGVLRPAKPVAIPGKPSALGVWVKGNAAWGRVIYRIKDAKGEIWSSTGTKDDWNCDDTFGWSYVNFEGWNYVRFPLPGNYPLDGARAMDSVWWGSLGGDGIPDLPFALESIVIEARNEAPVAGEMKVAPIRAYKLSGLVAEYAEAADAEPAAVKRQGAILPPPEWSGPPENKIAGLRDSGQGAAPAIDRFDEPGHWNDGRRMIVRFKAAEGFTYNLYLSRYENGNGAELLKAGVTDGLLVTGMRPDTTMYLFLTAVGPDKKESKPSKAFKLVTRDNFAEK